MYNVFDINSLELKACLFNTVKQLLFDVNCSSIEFVTFTFHYKSFTAFNCLP